jgi:predicted PurR-regulated permease PerM
MLQGGNSAMVEPHILISFMTALPKHISHGKEARFFFYLLMATAFVGVYMFVRDYIPTILFSFVLGVVLYPMYRRFHSWFGGRVWVALPLTYVVMAVVLTVPVAIAANLTVQVVGDFVGKSGNATFANGLSLPWLVDRINELANLIPGLNFQITPDQLSVRLQETAKTAGTVLFAGAQGFGNKIFNAIPSLFIAFSIVGALLTNYDRMKAYVLRLSPLGDQIDNLYIRRVKIMAVSMVRGTFIIALLQGTITGLFLWAAGVQYAAFLGLLAVIASIVPLGAGIIAIPIGIALILTGNVWQGALQIFGNLVIVSNLDNVLRPMLVHKEASLHPALVIVSLFAGIAKFGFLGAIFGPVIMIVFVTTLEVYMLYFREKDSGSDIRMA